MLLRCSDESIESFFCSSIIDGFGGTGQGDAKVGGMAGDDQRGGGI